MVETTILEGTQWAVFEPNDVALWEGVKRTLNGFLRGLWSAGALFGTSADQAFYVKCDAETNPPESIDAGQLVVEVGHRAGEAGRVRRLPHRAAQAVGQLSSRNPVEHRSCRPARSAGRDLT